MNLRNTLAPRWIRASGAPAWTGAVSAFVLAIATLSGCVGVDPDAPIPLLPLPPEARTVVRVEPMANEASSAEVAAVTSASTEMLRSLLVRSRRFSLVRDHGPAPGFSIETAITAFRDDDAAESLVYDSAQTANPRRVAVVEIRWRQADSAGRTLAEGVATGTDERIGTRWLGLPDADDLESGAYWNAPFGRATRAALVEIVKTVSGAG